jgi:hypothetical protein
MGADADAAVLLAREAAAFAHAVAAAEHVASRCDDLERLVVRKCVAKQPLHRFTHALSTCHTCTTDARHANGRTKTEAPGNQAYAHVKGAHLHAHRPNPRMARVVKGPGDLEAGSCRKLAKASAWRGVNDMAGAGRMGGGGRGGGGENSARNQQQHSKTRFGIGGGGISGGQRLQLGAMELPTQRSTGRSDLRRRIVNYFAYFDDDEVCGWPQSAQ